MEKQAILHPITFMSILEKVAALIDENSFDQSIQLIEQHLLDIPTIPSPPSQTNQFTPNEQVELLSIKSYALMMTNKFQQSLLLLDKCISIIPSHLSSHKRKATILEKMGNLEECKKQYNYCLLMEPESRSLKHKLKRLNMKSTHSSSCEGWSSDSKQSIKDEKISIEKEEQIKKSKNSVKFGNFQIIDITTEDSDERFAILRDQVNRLSSKKPKKSILKEPMSASIFKEKDYSAIQTQLLQISEQKIEELEDIQPESSGLIEKLEKKKKKKCKSVSFNEVSKDLEDFN